MMKNTFISIVSVFILLPAITYSQSQKVSVTLESVSLAYNNSVGNEWSTRAKVNGRYLFRGDSIHVNIADNGSLKLEGIAVEAEKYPDRGSGSKNISLQDLNINKPQLVTISVIVREDRGRYAGNSAKWEFKYRIQRIPS